MMNGGKNDRPTTPAPAMTTATAAPAPTPAPTASTEPTAEEIAENRYDGCMKLQIATDAAYSEAACSPAKIAKALGKKPLDTDERLIAARKICVMAGAQTYNHNNKRHELKRLPDDVAREIASACFMLVDGVGEKIAGIIVDAAIRDSDAEATVKKRR